MRGNVRCMSGAEGSLLRYCDSCVCEYNEGGVQHM